jgi:hypothetical protein
VDNLNPWSRFFSRFSAIPNKCSVLTIVANVLVLKRKRETRAEEEEEGIMNELPELLANREKFDEWAMTYLHTDTLAACLRPQLAAVLAREGVIASPAAHEFAEKIAADPTAAAAWVNAAERRARA